MPLDLSITNEQKIPVTLSPTTATGKPAALDGAVRISVISGGSSFTQDPANPLSFELVSSDTPGDTTFLIEGDADLTPDDANGGGVQLIQDTITLHVLGALAANLGLVAGAAVPKA